MINRPQVITIVAILIFVILDQALGSFPKVESLKIYLAALIAYFVFEFSQAKSDIESGVAKVFDSSIETLRSKIDAIHRNPLANVTTVNGITHLTEERFYGQLQYLFTSEAGDCVRISYMHRESPRNLTNTEQKSYYDGLRAIVEKRENIYFQRLILLTDGTREWVKDMISEYEGLQNFSLALIPWDDQNHGFLPLSIQCIDTEYTLLVAVASQGNVPPERDVIIKDPKLTEKFSLLYDKTFTRSTMVLRQGRRIEENIVTLRLDT